jgi:hypothetical protein
MQIRILEVSPVEDMGKYSKVNVSYSADGRNQEKAIMSFTAAYKELVKAKADDVFDIKLVKDKTGKYWNWEEAKKLDNADVAAVTRSAGKSVTTGNWETAEERAKKQVYIIRQSSISSAVAAMAVGSNTDMILSVARQFENYVLGIEEEEEQKEIE